jgi:murein DD-endopeptidase MepM/ murein hydrolase activator NlpD
MALAAMLWLTGCTGGARPSVDAVPSEPPPLPARKPTPPPWAVTVRQYPAPAPGSTVAARNLPRSPGTYRVEEGESLYRVSRKLDVSIRSLIDANDLAPPYRLQTGQRLLIVAPRSHVVEAGDTVYGISRRYRVALTELVRLNRIAAPYRIVPGQSLILPATAGRETAVATAALAGNALLPVEPLPVEPLPVEPPRAPPTRAPRSTLGPGDAPPPRKPERIADPGTAEPQIAEPRIANPSIADPGAGASQSAAIPQPPPRKGGKFLWPVKGEIVLGFGPKSGGLHNDGINIAAARGTPVRAAENGVVVYIGNQLRGFGNLLLIKHSDGWMTAYAHAETLLVRRGQTVRRGEAVARVGSTGSVSRPQLHFEVRKGTRAVDPARLLGPQAAAG